MNQVNRKTSSIELLLDHQGAIGRLAFIIAEVVRAVALLACYWLYVSGWTVIAITFVPAAIWPGIVATIKRLRDLGHDPVVILPILMYLSAGFKLSYKYNTPIIGGITLGLYLTYVSCFKGHSEDIGSG